MVERAPPIGGLELSGKIDRNKFDLGVGDSVQFEYKRTHCTGIIKVCSPRGEIDVFGVEMLKPRKDKKHLYYIHGSRLTKAML